MKTTTKQLRDRKGNAYDENDSLIEAYSGDTPIDDMHFWCIVCADVKPMDIPGGVVASREAGGWMCGAHGDQST